MKTLLILACLTIASAASVTFAQTAQSSPPDTLETSNESPASTTEEAQLSNLKPRQLEMFQAFCDGNTEAFLQITGKDYETVNADGSYMHREEASEYVKEFKGATFEIIEQEDRVYGNLVISTGRAKFYMASILAADVYFTQTWIYRDEGWQFIGWQGTMTGTPVNYPVYGLILIELILAGIVLLIVRIRRRRRVINHG